MATQYASPDKYGPPISLEAAKKAAGAALEVARKNNWTMAVSIVDTGGYLVYFEKMDDTQLASCDVSLDKARSATLFKRPTKAMQDMVEAGGVGLRVMMLRGAIPVEGGLPLISEGKIVGAIGLSGSNSENDGICAQAGVETLK